MDEMIEKVKNGYTLNIYKDKLELSTAVFKFIQSHIIHTLKKKERFKFCVSGGSTPKSVYKKRVKGMNGEQMSEVFGIWNNTDELASYLCLLYTSPSPRDRLLSRMPSSA